MYDELSNSGHSFNHLGSVKYYSPNELSRICRHNPDTDSIAGHGHSQQIERTAAKHHRTHHRHKNEINELDYELTTRKGREKRKHKKEHFEEKPPCEQFHSIAQHKERRKHKRSNKQTIHGVSELNHQDLQRLMNECNKDDNKPLNFSIGYYEIKRNQRCRSIDQIPTRDISSEDKISKISDSMKINVDMGSYKQLLTEHYTMSPGTFNLTDAYLDINDSQLNKPSDQHKTKRNKGKLNKGNEFVSEYKTLNSASMEQVNRRHINGQKLISRKYNYPERNSEDSLMRDRGKHRESIEEHYQERVSNIENKKYNQQISIQDNKYNDCGEVRSSQLLRAQDECRRDLSNGFVKDKAEGRKFENDDNNCKLMKKHMRKLNKGRESEDFRPKTRKIEYDTKQNMKNRNHYRNTHEKYSDYKPNEDKEKKKLGSKKHPNSLLPINLDDEKVNPTKMHNKKIEHRRHKSRKEFTRIKSTNESRLVNLSLDRAGNHRGNNNFHGVQYLASTGLNIKYKSESSLSTLHRKKDDLICLFKTEESVEPKIARCDTFVYNKKYDEVFPPSHKLETNKCIRGSSDNKEGFSPYIVDKVELPLVYDAPSMQRRVELFQTVMKKDLARPRSNFDRCGYTPIKMKTTLDKDECKEEIEINEGSMKGVHHFDVTTSTIQDKDLSQFISILEGMPDFQNEERSVIHVSETSSRRELFENTYGVIVKGVEPSKKKDTLKTNRINLSTEEKKNNNLECKILSVVAITPENVENQIEELDARVMRKISTSQLLQRDATSVRNPISDKRLERLLKYYRVEPHPDINGFTSCSGRSSKDRKLFKNLIISKLADYLKKLQEDNTGEIIEFRTDNPRVVKLILPIDCLSLECTYDINFSKDEQGDETAKESSSDLYINYSDIDDLYSDDHQKQIHSIIHTDEMNDEKTEKTIISNNDAEYLNKNSDLLFFNAPSSPKNPKTYKTEIVFNKRKFEKQPLNLTSPIENLKFMRQTQCQNIIDKRYSTVESLDIKNSSTFVVSENDQSSAHMNCLSNFQTSPRDSICIKSLQKADVFNQQRTATQRIETNHISSNNLNQKEFSELNENNTQIETVVTVQTIPQSKKFSDYFHSKKIPVKIDDIPNNGENITAGLELGHEYNKYYKLQPEIQEYSKKAPQLFVDQIVNEFARSDRTMKKDDCINLIDKSLENNIGFTNSKPEFLSREATHRNLEQNSEISALKNNNIRKTFEKSTRDIDFTVDINSSRIDDVVPDKKEDHPPNMNKQSFNPLLPTTIAPKTETELFLFGNNVTHKTQENNEIEHLKHSKCDEKKTFEEISTETNNYKSKFEEIQNFNNEQESSNKHISGVKELDQCLQKCLNWDIRHSSVMGEFADSDQNKASGLNKSTQMSSNVPKRSQIPIAKKDIRKFLSGQMRSSSVGRDNNTTLLLTKSYRIPIGQSSYEKRKLYDTSFRKNVKRRSLSESSGTTNKNPLIYEVRYFNIHNQCVPPLLNQTFRRDENTGENIVRYSDNLNEDNTWEKCYDSLSNKPSICLKQTEFNLSSVKTEDPDENRSKQNFNNQNYLHDNSSRADCKESYAECLISPRDFLTKYVHESRKMKEICHNFDLKKVKSCNQRSQKDPKCSEIIPRENKKNLTLQKRNREKDIQNIEKCDDSMSYIHESQNHENLTKLSIEKVDNNELFLFFGNQNLFSSETQSSKNFDEKSAVSSSAEGEISENLDSLDDNTISSGSTLVNSQVYSSTTTTESKETVKAVQTREIIEHSINDSGYLTKDAEINYSITTLDGGTKKGASKLSLQKTDDEKCKLVKSRTSNSRWSQKDLLRLKLQLLFPNVYDDFELIEAAEHTELIKFYIESANDKLIGAVETISRRKKEMSVKSRSVISLPSAKIIPRENGLMKSFGDVPADPFFRMTKGGFYNYQKFIAQNNDQYSSDILSKIKYAEDYTDGGETLEDEYPRSETSSMKSSSLNSVKSNSTRKSIIELFKLRSSKNVVSSSEVIATQDDFSEREIERSNISEEQFSNHFHQIMALECQKFAKKVKNQSLLRENTNQIEEFEEIPLESILKNRNISSRNRTDCINFKSLPSLIESDDNRNIDETNEFPTPTRDHFSDRTNPTTNVRIADEECVISKVHTTLTNNCLPKKTSKSNSDCYPQENQETLPCGKLTKQPEKEYFDNLLTFYDHESEFTTKLIRDNEFFVSLLEKIRNDDDSLNVIYHKDIQKQSKKEKKPGILTRLFRRKKKSNEVLFMSPSMSKSLEFAKSLSCDSNSVRRESCYSFFKDIEDFEKGASEKKHTIVASTEILKKLACKTKSHLEPMVQASLSNQHINDRIKLAGFLKFLDMIEKGDITYSSNVNHKCIVEEKLREHVAQLFEKVYRIANREVVQRNIILDDKKIELLKMLVTKYHMGVDVHINILAIYIGRSLIQSRSQLEDAILCLMRLNTDEVNLEEFERNCGIYRVQ